MTLVDPDFQQQLSESSPVNVMEAHVNLTNVGRLRRKLTDWVDFFRVCARLLFSLLFTVLYTVCVQLKVKFCKNNYSIISIQNLIEKYYKE